MANGIVHVDVQGLDRYRLLFESAPKIGKKALNLAIGRALQSGKTAAVTETTKLYTIKASRVRKSLKISRSGPGGAALVASSRRATLSSYHLVPKRDTTGAKRTPLKVEVRRTGLKSLGRAFVHNGLPFRRVGEKRYPLEVLYGPSPTEAISNEEVSVKVIETMQETTGKRFIHEMDRLLGKQNARK